MHKTATLIAAACIAVAGIGGFVHAARTHAASRPVPEIPQVSRIYGTQKVLYHLTQPNGWFADDHARTLQTIKNHIAAVGAANLTARVILQGGGVDVLTRAKTDETFRAEVDFLRANGVRFIVCRNTLVSRKIAMDALHGFKAEDLVPAGVSEAAALMQQGFVYLKI